MSSQRALMAFKGEGEAVPGEWCKFCRAKPVCRALAEQAMNLAAGDFAEVEPETSIEEKTQHQEISRSTSSLCRHSTTKKSKQSFHR